MLQKLLAKAGRSTNNVSSYLVWSPYKIWLSFVVPRGVCRNSNFGTTELFGIAVVYDLRETRLYPTYLTMPNMVVLDHMIRAYVRRSEEKCALRVLPFKVTQSHRNQHRSIEYLWLSTNPLFTHVDICRQQCRWLCQRPKLLSATCQSNQAERAR